MHPSEYDLLKAINESDAARERAKRSALIRIEQARVEAAMRLGEHIRSNNARAHAVLGYFYSLPMFRPEALHAMARLDPSGGLPVARHIAASIERTRRESQVASDESLVASDEEWSAWIESI